MARKKEPEWKVALREAVVEAGSLSALGRQLGCHHAKLTMALKGKSISAELARDVSAVSQIPNLKHRMRPDLWPAE